MILFYLTHPEVVIDPAVPVPEWGLSDKGRARAALAACSPRLANVRTIVSSAETKAVETAAMVGDEIGVIPTARNAMHENDRSATGFLPPPEFETVADRFFAEPQTSVRGWERAVDAQRRIVSEVEAVLAEAPDDGDVLLAGHGGVGTLLYCHLAGIEIARAHDQRGGGGCVFAYDVTANAMVHPWRRIEDL